MAQGSGVSVHLRADDVPYHAEAYPLAEMGLFPAGAYRNRQYAEAGVCVKGKVSRTLQDLFYDPQTSGGLLFALPEQDAQGCLDELQQSVPEAKIRRVCYRKTGVFDLFGVNIKLRMEN